jgi:hypothetical protein
MNQIDSILVIHLIKENEFHNFLHTLWIAHLKAADIPEADLEEGIRRLIGVDVVERRAPPLGVAASRSHRCRNKGKF